MRRGDQTLVEAYAVVAMGSDPDSTRVNINTALAGALHVMFPAGTYRFSGTILFGLANQRAVFQAGAVLEPADSTSFVKVTASDQAIEGMCIDATAVPACSPLVDITEDTSVNPIIRASLLYLEDLVVDVGALSEPTILGPKCAVRVSAVVGVRIMGGRLTGSSQAGTVGVWFAYNGDRGNGAWEIALWGTTVERFGWGAQVACTADDPSFYECRFIDNVDGGIRLGDNGEFSGGDANSVYGFDIVSCHFEGSSAQFIEIGAGWYWNGSVVAGCTFGAPPTVSPTSSQLPAQAVGNQAFAERSTSSRRFGSAAKADPRMVRQARGLLRAFPSLQSRGAFQRGEVSASIVTRVPADLAVPAFVGGTGNVPHLVDRCVLRVHGRVSGVVVTGCQSTEDSRTTAWVIEDDSNSAYNYGALVSQSCDLFNCWAQGEVAAGAGANALVTFGTTRSGIAKIGAESITLDSAALGCFGADAGAQGGGYTLGTGRSHFVTAPSGPAGALAQLLEDLAALGVITV